MNAVRDRHFSEAIAIVGMAGRFPGAPSVGQFWENLKAGRESISVLTDEELLASGIDAALLSDPLYVKARGVLDDVDLFDAPFFGFTPREAELTDPQHRLFLETCFRALEDAGCNPATFDGGIGVFGGMTMNTYLLAARARDARFWKELTESYQIGGYPSVLGNDYNFLATRVSYKLDLKGPSVDIQSACSTSLVAVCLACRALLQHDCDAALAGGVSITFPQKRGYFYQEGAMGSPDGKCRAFDAAAGGTVFGSGVGVVVLKRLSDALAQGDSIVAVIRGFALNNDGSSKVGYMAPSVEGQAEVIVTAQARADVDAESIGYVETHGTGTPLGDPIEIAGLTRAFRSATTAKGFCAIGSVKPNVGHLDIASGVTGLIKAALAVRTGLIPPSLHFEHPNPAIDFASSPFFMNTRLSEWRSSSGPRRAGVSAFGVGGTNAHVILEEAPAAQAPSARSCELLVLSAKTATGLDAAAANLAAHLAERPEVDLANVAFTLQAGRRRFAHRRALVCANVAQAVSGLSSPSRGDVTDARDFGAPSIAFLFPGQGAQRPGMARELYESESRFREEIERCCNLLGPEVGKNLLGLLITPPKEGEIPEESPIHRTGMAQPALFAVEYALARLWESWGVRPAAMLGHSLGEFVAATLAGVFSLEDALALVAARGRLIEALPEGSMLAVRMEEDQLATLARPGLSLAAVNAPALCVLSGAPDVIEGLGIELQERGIVHRRLETSHAFHSEMMDPVVGPFEELVRKVRLRPPSIPFVSSVTGTWISAEEATNPAYWGRHLRQPVRFARAVGELFEEKERTLLEVGPGQTLSLHARRHPANTNGHTVLASLSHPENRESDRACLLRSLGQLWVSGVAIDWPQLQAGRGLRRVPLPTYPFERSRHWIGPYRDQALSEARSDGGRETEPSPTRIDGTLAPPGKAELQPMNESPAPAPSRHSRLLSRVQSLFGDLSGLAPEQVSPSSTFLEIGFDSLLLTQASQHLHKQFGVRIAFRDLMGEASTPDALASYLDARLSPEILPPAPRFVAPVAEPPAAPSPRSAPLGAAPAAESSGILERMAEQLRVMSEQLAILRGDAPTPALPGAMAPTPTAPPPTPSSAAEMQAGGPLPSASTDSERVEPHAPPLAASSSAAPEKGRPADFPLTDAQEEVWLACQMGTEASCAFNEGISLRLRGPLDVPALTRSLEGMVARHDALRTTFESGGDLQRVGDVVPIPMSVTDLADCRPADAEARRRQILLEEARTPFDLGRAPLVRARLVRFAAENHVLVLTAHHLAVDGWSMNVLLDDLASLYSSLRSGTYSPRPAAADFFDFAAREQARRSGPGAAETDAYWLAEFTSPPPVLDLPTDRPRPAAMTYAGATVRRTIPSALAAAVRRTGAKEGCTLFTTLFAAFAGLLHRLTGQEDLVVGIPAAGQAMDAGEDLVGHCVNFLSIRSRAPRQIEVREYLRSVRKKVLDAYDHQDSTYGSLIQKLALPRDPSRLPLVEAHFNLDRIATGLHWEGLQVEVDTNPKSFVNGDIFLNVVETAEGLVLDCDFSTDLFDLGTVERWLEYFERLLEGIVEDAARPLSALALWSNAERDRVLIEWNRTRKEYPREKTVHRLFEEQAERTPEAVAVELEGERVTYGQLNERANRLARYLSKRGVGPEVLVALCVERSLEMVVGLVGILKAGGAYLPLDPAYPAERLRFMLEDAGVTLVLTQGNASENLPGGVRRVRLDADWADIERESGENPAGQATAESLAYVIYTSGSTGKPKGVEIEHRSLANYIRFAADRFGLRAGERILQFASLSFDTSAEEIFPALSGGATLVLRSEEMISTVSTFIARCREWNLTVLDFPTSYWHELVAVASAEQLSLPESVRLVVIGGERALPERFRQWRELTGNRVQLLNSYGPTEATVAATFWEPDAGLKNSLAETVPIGRPISNVRAYVLDGELQPVPVGILGELYIGGAGLARGYRNRPELTAEKFIPDPFRGGGERLYRTGDRVRYWPDGNLEYVGRVDGQIKLRGFRVEPGEVETELLGIVGVREAVVRVDEDVPGQPRLIGYVVPEPARPLSVGDLRRLLNERLPAYMVPSAFVLLDRLPRTPTGKLDSEALPPPESARPELDDAFQGPRTPIEETLTSIWVNLLGVEGLGVHDNFFELGGHSLLAMRVISRARDAFHVELPLRDLFLNPTVADLALIVAQRQAESVEPVQLERLLSELETPTAETAPNWLPR